MNLLKKLYAFMRETRKRICGEAYFIFRLLIFPIFTITKRDAHHFNVFVLFIPFLQIVTGPKTYRINLLLFAWLYKGIKYLFTGWGYVNQPELVRFTFCGKTIYEKRAIKPYDFPSTKFRDKQVNG